MTQENSPSESTDAPETADPSVTGDLSEKPTSDEPDASAVTNEEPSPEVVTDDSRSASKEAPDPYTASLLAGTLHPAPSIAGYSETKPAQRKASTLMRVLVVMLVVAVAVTTAILFFIERGTSPITSTDFKRLSTSLSGTEGFGEFRAQSMLASQIDECDAYSGFDDVMKEAYEAYPGFNGSNAVLLLRFLEHGDALEFAAASSTCVEQNDFAGVTTTEARVGGLFSVVKVYEIAGEGSNADLVLHIAVYRNVVLWNLNNATAPMTMEDWKTWAGDVFLNLVDDSRVR